LNLVSKELHLTKRKIQELQMLIQTVKFETTLSEEEVLRRADERADDYRAIPGLSQKYYIKLDKPNHYGGVLVWESKQALEAFRETELSKTIPAVYGVKGSPCIRVVEVFDKLRTTL
jgi:heme-degrading monooxygenase HmoA